MRTCSTATKHKIKQMGYFRNRPAWLRAAVNDALSDKPMSIQRERRMCEALGIEPPQRKRYYRPCVDPEIGEVIKDMGIDVNAVLLEYLTARDALP